MVGVPTADPQLGSGIVPQVGGRRRPGRGRGRREGGEDLKERTQTTNGRQFEGYPAQHTFGIHCQRTGSLRVGVWRTKTAIRRYLHGYVAGDRQCVRITKQQQPGMRTIRGRGGRGREAPSRRDVGRTRESCARPAASCRGRLARGTTTASWGLHANSHPNAGIQVNACGMNATQHRSKNFS